MRNCVTYGRTHFFQTYLIYHTGTHDLGNDLTYLEIFKGNYVLYKVISALE